MKDNLPQRPQLVPLSKEAKEAHMPTVKAVDLMNALEGPIHKEVGPTRSAQVGNKLREIKNRDGEEGKVIGYGFHCPGCNVEHKVFIYPYKAIDGTSWDFIGTLNRPSITPGIVNQRQSADGSTSICHVHLLAGKLWFLTSCTHKLAGEIIDMVPVKQN